MKLKEFLEKWGYATPAIILSRLAENCPPTPQGAMQFKLACELRDDLEALLKKAVESK